MGVHGGHLNLLVVEARRPTGGVEVLVWRTDETVTELPQESSLPANPLLPLLIIIKVQPPALIPGLTRIQISRGLPLRRGGCPWEEQPWQIVEDPVWQLRILHSCLQDSECQEDSRNI